MLLSAEDRDTIRAVIGPAVDRVRTKLDSYTAAELAEEVGKEVWDCGKILTSLKALEVELRLAGDQWATVDIAATKVLTEIKFYKANWVAPRTKEV